MTRVLWYVKHRSFSSVGDSKPAICQPSGLRVWVQMLRESQIFVETSRCFSSSELPKVAVFLAFLLAFLNPQDQLHEMADELLNVASQAA